MSYDRLVRSELYHSERWLSLPSDTHRLVYNALIHLADDFGNLEGGAIRLWLWMRNFSQVKTEQDSIKIMSDLADTDLLRAYQVQLENRDDAEAPKEFWHLPRFHNKRTYWKRICPPSPWCDATAYTGPYKGQQVIAKPKSNLNQISFKSESTLNPGVGVGVKKTLMSKSLRSLDERIKKTLRPKREVLNGAFLEFWDAYPKRKAKAQAEKAWIKLNPSKEQVDIILQALCRQRDSPDWRKESGQYIPLPATWLNGRRWDDEGVMLPARRPEVAV